MYRYQGVWMKNDRFLVGIISFIGLLMVLAVVLFFVRQEPQDYGPEDSPQGVVRNYVLALQGGDRLPDMLPIAETASNVNCTNGSCCLSNMKGWGHQHLCKRPESHCCAARGSWPDRFTPAGNRNPTRAVAARSDTAP